MIEELIEEAGTLDAPPPPPEGKIPKQWLPGWIRWPLRLLAFPFVMIDLTMQKLARRLIRPPFKREGKCKKRGNCCYYILVRAPRGILSYLFYLWAKEVDGFFVRDKRPQEYLGKKMIVMGCRYLKKDGSCKHYHLRPMICRQWPIIEYFGYPRILKGCGYKAVVKEKENKSSPLNILQ